MYRINPIETGWFGIIYPYWVIGGWLWLAVLGVKRNKVEGWHETTPPTDLPIVRNEQYRH